MGNCVFKEQLFTKKDQSVKENQIQIILTNRFILIIESKDF